MHLPDLNRLRLLALREFPDIIQVTDNYKCKNFHLSQEKGNRYG